MEVPAFPSPPALVSRSISLDNSHHHHHHHHQQQRHWRRADEQQFHSTAVGHESRPRRRPRSASWLVARKRACHSRRNNHVQPAVLDAYSAAAEATVVAARRTGRRHLAAELTLTMTESGCAPEEADRSPKGETLQGLEDGPEALQRIREGTSPQTIKEDHVDESEIICCATPEANNDWQRAAQPTVATSIPERPTPQQVNQTGVGAANSVATTAILPQKNIASIGMQTIDRVLYRLRVFPILKDIVDEENKPPDPKKPSRIFRYFRFLGRVALCQFGLAWLLTLWAILGAGAFYITEGPRERQQVVELKDMQRDLAVGLATELRQLRSADEKEMEPLWSNKVRQYVARHEKLLLIAVSSGYGEGGDNGQLWTFPGCVLFAVSVLTTLGFGAPVPRTNAGRTVAVVFAAIGIPAHFILMLNLGLLLAVKLKRYGIMKRYPNECRDHEILDSMPMPMWVKVLPFLGIGIYYILGILCFGVGRLRPFSDSLLFPLDFTAAGGLSTIAGYVRILYGVFLEGAVTLAAIAVAVLKVSATQSLTNIGLKYGLLVPA